MAGESGRRFTTEAQRALREAKVQSSKYKAQIENSERPQMGTDGHRCGCGHVDQVIVMQM